MVQYGGHFVVDRWLLTVLYITRYHKRKNEDKDSVSLFPVASQP